MSAARLVALEQYQEILDELTPGQLVVVALLMEHEMSYNQIAAEIGMTKQAVASRINQAARRIARAFPELVYEARRPRRYGGPGDGLTDRDLSFIRGIVDLEKRGEVVTLPALIQELGLDRNTIYRTFKGLQDRGLVSYGLQVGRTCPLCLNCDPGLVGGAS